MLNFSLDRCRLNSFSLLLSTIATTIATLEAVILLFYYDIKTSRPGQNGPRFANDIFKSNYLDDEVVYWLNFTQSFLKGPDYSIGSGNDLTASMQNH